MLRKGESRPIVVREELRNAMTKSLIHGKQVIFIFNIGGMCHYWSCTDCEYIPCMQTCGTSLNLHKKANILKMSLLWI